MTTLRHGSRGLFIALVALVAGACGGPRDPQTPAEMSARGEQLLGQMSDTLKAAPALSFTVQESHERVRRNGEKQPYTLSRQLVIRRPDRMWFHTTGSDGRDVKVGYDGKALTVLGQRQKVYATFNAPPTLDETLDLISDRYDLRVAVADFLYSSPRESFADREAQGGWSKKTTVGGNACEELSYTMKAVDLTISVRSAPPVVPCEAHIVFKKETGKPVTHLVFSDWNLDPKPEDAQFALSVPDGYEKIPVIERIPKAEIKADAAKAMGVAGK